LYVKEQKEEEDVTREIFVLLDSAPSPARIVTWNKIAAVPRTSTIVIAASARSARTGATTGSLWGVFLVGHVLASNTREVDASPAACDPEIAATLIVCAKTRSAQRSKIQ